MTHKHKWQLVRIYYKSPFNHPFDEKRVASFICSCGVIKEVVVKVKEREE